MHTHHISVHSFSIATDNYPSCKWGCQYGHSLCGGRNEKKYVILLCTVSNLHYLCRGKRCPGAGNLHWGVGAYRCLYIHY